MVMTASPRQWLVGAAVVVDALMLTGPLAAQKPAAPAAPTARPNIRDRVARRPCPG